MGKTLFWDASLVGFKYRMLQGMERDLNFIDEQTFINMSDSDLVKYDEWRGTS